MIAYIQKFVNSLNKPKNWLILANVLVVFFLIVLGNANVIPLDMGDFVFFSILTLAFALWRPGWAFLLFCGTVPLENINLAPVSLGMTIRPYQFIGGILILALVIRKLTGRLNFKLPRFNLADWAVVILVIAGFLSAIGTSIDVPMMAPIKLSIILFSFAALYFLTRIYIQDIPDLKKTIPFFLSSTIVVALYGIWQNIVFLRGGNSFEAMPGRPNATFTEADWLGAFIVLMTAVIYGIIYYFSKNKSEKSYAKYQILNTRYFLYIILTILYIILILTVSRSAWLAALVAYIIFVLIFFTDLKFKNWQWKTTSILKLKIISSLVVAILIVFVFHLTNFQLGNRVQSTGSGLQKITVACDHETNLPESIKDVSELQKHDCRFINLEDIENEKVAGKIVTEVYRDDPNVSARAEIYQKSWSEIKNHPVLGIGWGNIGSVLGQDGRGVTLNSSNIFLEIWLGAGIVGILGLLVIFGFILFNSIRNFFHAQDFTQKTFYLFLLVSWFGIIVFNLFNAGIFLGFLWMWLAVAQAKD